VIEKIKKWAIERDKYDIIDVNCIISSWKIRANAKEDKVKINEKGTIAI